MRLIETVLIIAVSLAGCAGGPVASRVFDSGEDATLPRVVRDAFDRLPAAGGGRPMTGYVGASASLVAPFGRDLSAGFGLDVNYTHNLAERLSVELALGTIRMGIDIPPDDKGTAVITSMGATVQAGHPVGSARWYAGLGLAYWINGVTGATADLDDSFAVIASGGIALPLHLRASLGIELRCLWSRSRLDGVDADLSAFAARVNYVFLY